MLRWPLFVPRNRFAWSSFGVDRILVVEKRGLDLSCHTLLGAIYSCLRSSWRQTSWMALCFTLVVGVIRCSAEQLKGACCRSGLRERRNTAIRHILAWWIIWIVGWLSMGCSKQRYLQIRCKRWCKCLLQVTEFTGVGKFTGQNR
jgi:hypothetical protein